MDRFPIASHSFGAAPHPVTKENGGERSPALLARTAFDDFCQLLGLPCLAREVPCASRLGGKELVKDDGFDRHETIEAKIKSGRGQRVAVTCFDAFTPEMAALQLPVDLKSRFLSGPALLPLLGIIRFAT